MRESSLHVTVANYVDKIVCNMCGGELNIDSETEEYVLDFFHKLSISFGYADPNDGEIHNFDLCSDCILKLENMFKIPVDVEHFI